MTGVDVTPDDRCGAELAELGFPPTPPLHAPGARTHLSPARPGLRSTCPSNLPCRVEGVPGKAHSSAFFSAGASSSQSGVFPEPPSRIPPSRPLHASAVTPYVSSLFRFLHKSPAQACVTISASTPAAINRTAVHPAVRLPFQTEPTAGRRTQRTLPGCLSWARPSWSPSLSRTTTPDPSSAVVQLDASLVPLPALPATTSCHLSPSRLSTPSASPNSHGQHPHPGHCRLSPGSLPQSHLTAPSSLPPVLRTTAHGVFLQQDPTMQLSGSKSFSTYSKDKARLLGRPTRTQWTGPHPTPSPSRPQRHADLQHHDRPLRFWASDIFMQLLLILLHLINSYLVYESLLNVPSSRKPSLIVLSPSRHSPHGTPELSPVTGTQ